MGPAPKHCNAVLGLRAIPIARFVAARLAFLYGLCVDANAATAFDCTIDRFPGMDVPRALLGDESG